MADPTLALTFEKLCIRVAEYLGIAHYGVNGDEAAQLPASAHDLDKVKRIVNDGYRRFLLDNERGWNFLTVPLSITFGTNPVDGDASRYYLPDDSAGIIVSPFTYPPGQSRITVEPVSEQQLRELAAASASSGLPQVFCVRAVNTTVASTGQRWEAVFWPAPSGTQTVTGLYKRFPAALVNNSDMPVCGLPNRRNHAEACRVYDAG